MGDLLAGILLTLMAAAVAGWIGYEAMQQLQNQGCVDPNEVICLNCADGYTAGVISGTLCEPLPN